MSDYEEIKANCLESDHLFEDADFPASTESIYYKRTGLHNWDNIEWKRPGDLCSDPQFSLDGATRFDLDQGALGNCWFLSAAATLATKSDLFRQVVPPGQTFNAAYAGIFRFRFWRFGHWYDIYVDDLLPCRGDKLVFCKNREHPNEFWSALLEKAYAKVHGSYQALDSGYSHDALVDFTGGIGEFIDLEPGVPDPEKLFRSIRRVFRMNSLICAAINVKDGGSPEITLDNGLVTGHAYSLTKIAKLVIDDVEHKIVRMRNPWGHKEWNGAWSDGSSEWNGVSDDVKNKFQLTTENEGEFWMPFGDFVANFHTIQICHLTPDSTGGTGQEKGQWNITTLHGSWVTGVTAGGCGVPPHAAEYWSNPQFFVHLRDPTPDDEDPKCTLVISLIQKYRRQMRTALKSVDGLEEAIGFDILKFKGNEPQELDGSQFDETALRIERKMESYEYLRERSHRYQLEEGAYCIIPCTYEPDVEAEFMIRIATEQPVESGELDSEVADTNPIVNEGQTPNSPGPKLGELFNKHSGDDGVIDARELKRILNEGLKRDHDEEFSKETSRALLANVAGRGGTLDVRDCRKVWRRVKKLQNLFDKHDKDSSGLLDRREVRQSFKGMGFGFSKRTMAAIVSKYCGKEAGLTIDDFMLVATKTTVLFERYKTLSDRGDVTITLEEWLEATLFG